MLAKGVKWDREREEGGGEEVEKEVGKKNSPSPKKFKTLNGTLQLL